MNLFVVVIFQLASLVFLQQEPNGAVTGRVTTKDGKGVAGITVRLFTAPDGFGVRATGRPTDAAGRYRLENIPPGRYYVAANASDLLTYNPGVNDFTRATAIEVRRGETLTVADFPLAGLKVRGRASVDHAGPLPRIALTFTSEAGRAWVTVLSPAADGAFETTLPEGEWRVAWDSAFPLPAGYALKELKYGNQDGLQRPIKIGNADRADLRAELRAELNVKFSAGSKAWVKVEGRVKGIDPAIRGYEIVLVSDGSTHPLKTDVRRDGTFEFPQVLQGPYSMNLIAVGGIPLSQMLTVENRNLSNVEIAAPAQTEATGEARVEGGMNGALILRFRLTQGGKSTVISAVTALADGAFKVALPDGEFQAALVGIAPESVREFRYGATDLFHNPLRVSHGAPQTLYVRLAPGVETGGLAANAPSAPRAETIVDGVRVRPATLLLQTTPQYSPEAREARIIGSVILEAIVREDGTVAVVRTVRTLGHGLDEEAIAAIEQWRFRPATQDGVPVAVQSLIEVNFRLR